MRDRQRSLQPAREASSAPLTPYLRFSPTGDASAFRENQDSYMPARSRCVPCSITCDTAAAPALTIDRDRLQADCTAQPTSGIHISSRFSTAGLRRKDRGLRDRFHADECFHIETCAPGGMFSRPRSCAQTAEHFQQPRCVRPQLRATRTTSVR